MGDAGALFLGVLLATLTVRFEPTAQSQLGSFLIPVLLLAIPILDTTVAVLSRIRRHLSPFQGGQDHLSHRLIRSGLTRKTSAIILWSLSGLFAAVSVLISTAPQSCTNYLLICAGSTWLSLFIAFFRTKDI
jgi:UDP-GlcNAc:undecaprenyl-phosphate GlcNAc-1-phosphate transferase